MNFREIIKVWLLAKLGIEQIGLPSDGRSSIEKTGLGYGLENFSNRYNGVSPIIDFSVLKTLKTLWLYHPEFSQHISNLVSLANTGHQLAVNADNSAKAETAVARLNETAARIYQHGAGVDGLINQELTSAAWSGAISTEDVVNLTARRIENVVFVPVEDIRFQYIDNQWQPFQYVGIGRGNSKTGLIPLHPETYRYFAVETIDNSPYAKPPATASVEAITNMQNEVIENVKYIVNKFSILGLLSVMVRRLTKKPNETDGEFEARSQKYLKDVRDSLSGSFNKGLLVAYDNMQFKGENVAANGSGFYDVYRVIGETVMSGLRQQPAFFGRTDSTTETYADVVYNFVLSQSHNLQRIVKRRRERTYMLDLRLGGLEINGVSVNFNKAFSRNILAEAQARQTEITNAIEKAKAGIISADEAAQELGYEAAFDSAILEEAPSLANALQVLSKSKLNTKFTFQFDKRSNKYRFVQTVINLETNGDITRQSNVVDIKKKDSIKQSLKLTEEQIDEILDKFIEEYFSRVGNFTRRVPDFLLERLRKFLRDNKYDDFTDAKDFAEQAFGEVSDGLKSFWDSAPARKAINRVIESIYKFYRLKDITPFGEKSPVKLRFGGADIQSVKFFGELDHFYFSKFSDNRSQQLKDFLRERYLENGSKIFGKRTPEELQDFREAAGEKLENLTDRAIDGIIHTSVQRIRVWGHIGSMAQGGIKLGELVAIIDDRTTELCRGLDGKLIRIGVAQKAIERLNKLEPGEFAKEMYESAAGKAISKDPVNFVSKFLEDDGKTIGDDLVTSGRGFPPFHVKCRTRVKAVIAGQKK